MLYLNGILVIMVAYAAHRLMLMIAIRHHWPELSKKKKMELLGDKLFGFKLKGDFHGWMLQAVQCPGNEGPDVTDRHTRIDYISYRIDPPHDLSSEEAKRKLQKLQSRGLKYKNGALKTWTLFPRSGYLNSVISILEEN
jgi:hypothetical protein